MNDTAIVVVCDNDSTHTGSFLTTPLEISEMYKNYDIAIFIRSKGGKNSTEVAAEWRKAHPPLGYNILSISQFQPSIDWSKIESVYKQKNTSDRGKRAFELCD